MLSLQFYRKTSGNDVNSIVLHIHLKVHVSNIMKRQSTYFINPQISRTINTFMPKYFLFSRMRRRSACHFIKKKNIVQGKGYSFKTYSYQCQEANQLITKLYAYIIPVGKANTLTLVCGSKKTEALISKTVSNISNLLYLPMH
jgi:hypothetical protein